MTVEGATTEMQTASISAWAASSINSPAFSRAEAFWTWAPVLADHFVRAGIAQALGGFGQVFGRAPEADDDFGCR